jgi:hypothetical protein
VPNFDFIQSHFYKTNPDFNPYLFLLTACRKEADDIIPGYRKWLAMDGGSKELFLK